MGQKFKFRVKERVGPFSATVANPLAVVLHHRDDPRPRGPRDYGEIKYFGIHSCGEILVKAKEIGDCPGLFRVLLADSAQHLLDPRRVTVEREVTGERKSSLECGQPEFDRRLLLAAIVVQLGRDPGFPDLTPKCGELEREHDEEDEVDTDAEKGRRGRHHFELAHAHSFRSGNRQSRRRQATTLSTRNCDVNSRTEITKSAEIEALRGWSRWLRDPRTVRLASTGTRNCGRDASAFLRASALTPLEAGKALALHQPTEPGLNVRVRARGALPRDPRPVGR